MIAMKAGETLPPRALEGRVRLRDGSTLRVRPVRLTDALRYGPRPRG